MSTEFQRRVLELTNQERAKNGLSPLTYDSRLNVAADQYSATMANGDFFSHTGLDGSTPTSRANTVGFPGGVAENIGAGYTSPEAAVQGWMNSPGHRANILNPTYKSLGVGYFYLANDTGSEDWGHYWTQNFGLADGDGGQPIDTQGQSGGNTSGNPPPVGTAVHRFYDFLTGTHFYTADGAEQQQYAGDSRYRYEGAAFKTVGSESVSRFRNKQADTYFYTLSDLERETVKGYAGFEYQSGKEFGASSTPMVGTIPVYRFYNLNTGTHFFTPSASERDAVIAAFPGLMRNEGIGFYANPI